MVTTPKQDSDDIFFQSLNECAEERKPVQKTFSLANVLDLSKVKNLKNENIVSPVDIIQPFIQHNIIYNTKKAFTLPREKFVRVFKKPDCEILNIIDDLSLDSGVDLFLAGGKMVSYFNQQDNDNDFDLFFISSEELVKFLDYVKDNKDFQFLTALGYLTEYLYKNKYKFQIIQKEYSSYEEILETFDIRACSIGYYNKTVIWLNGTLKDIKNKEITINNLPENINTRRCKTMIMRINKYIQKGYNIKMPYLFMMNCLFVDSFMKDIVGDSYYNDIEELLNLDFRFERRSVDYDNWLTH